MKSRSAEVDSVLLRTVKQAPGLSLYELCKLLHWSNGKVDGTVRRLINSKKVLVNAIERDGRQVNLVYPKTAQSFDVIDIPISMLKLGNPLWKDVSFIYALDSTNIGVAGTKHPEWEKLGCLKKKVKLTSKGKHFVVKIPEPFVRFYHLEDKHITKTINGNNVLLTIDGHVVTNKAYPAK